MNEEANIQHSSVFASLRPGKTSKIELRWGVVRTSATDEGAKKFAEKYLLTTQISRLSFLCFFGGVQPGC
jgi:hypothetical protein